MVYSNNFNQVRVGVRVVTQVVNAVDADATAFIAAAGITNLTQAAAISTLVDDLKTYGLWTKMKALYPFVGGSAASHKFNLKDPRDLDAAYRLVFSGGWTHTSTGAKPNGTTGYADTKLVPSNNLSQNSTHISSYIRNTTTGVLMGTDNNAIRLWMSPNFNGSSRYVEINTTTTTPSVFPISSIGFWLGNRTANNSSKLFLNNNVNYSHSTLSTGLDIWSIFLASRNDAGNAINFSSAEISLSSIGDGLSDTEESNFYTAVQKFNSTLGRQIGTPVVSDSDATAFISAAGITNNEQANAVNTLVTDLKTAGIWTKMKAIYPFVGGTAESHKWNLKDPRDLDAAFRLVFNGGWTHSSTGALPNGTTGYADTKFSPISAGMSTSSFHMSNYARNPSSTGTSRTYIGSRSLNPPYMTALGWLSGGSQEVITIAGDSDGTGYSPTPALSPSTAGMKLGTTNTNRYSRLYRNGVYQPTQVLQTQSFNPYNLYIASLNTDNTAGIFSNVETAFASIGDGLTDTEAANFYTAVQTFQTTLGRQVGVPIVADADAQAFLDAAVITSTTQASAVNTLVTDLKSANIWSKMRAIYPFVGGTATTHKFNLKDPRDLDAAYRLTFNGGWTHSSTGALPNGTTGYADTFLTPNVMSQNNIHVSFYSRTDAARNSPDISSWAGGSTGGINIYPKSSTNNIVYYLNDNTTKSISAPSSTGLYTVTRLTSTTADMFRNGVKIVNGTSTSTSPSTYKIYLGAENNVGSAGSFSTREQAFATIGDGLTDAEAAAFYTAVQKYQTTLGRQV